MDWTAEGQKAATVDMFGERDDVGFNLGVRRGRDWMERTAADRRQFLAERFARELAAVRWGAWHGHQCGQIDPAACKMADDAQKVALDLLSGGFDARLRDVAPADGARA